MRTLVGVGMAVALVGCQSRTGAYGGLAVGGTLLVAGAIATQVEQENKSNDKSEWFHSESPVTDVFLGVGVVIALVAVISLPFTSEPDEHPNLGLAPPSTPPIVDGDSRPLPDGLAGVGAVVTRCGRALGITGVVRVQIVAVDGRVTGHPELPREDFAGCIAAELAGVTLRHSSKIDTTMSFLVN